MFSVFSEHDMQTIYSGFDGNTYHDSLLRKPFVGNKKISLLEV